MKKCFIVLGLAAAVLLMALSPSQRSTPVGVTHTLGYFRSNAVLFAESTADLRASIHKLGPSTVEDAKESLKKCRMQFKNIEFFFNYFFRSLTIIYNSPAVIEVEEPFMEYREPTGLQVIEALLFSEDPVAVKKELIQQIELVYESAQDINSLLYGLQINDKQILESIRLELISVISMGIAGFDAPELKTGIAEANQTLLAIKTVLAPYVKADDSAAFYLDKAIAFTASDPNFDTFDRAEFLTGAALPLQYHLGILIRENNWELNTTAFLNYKSRNLFSPDAININGRLSIDTVLAGLGKKLFFDKRLSGNNSRSCATCHSPEKYFTDALPKSLTLDGHSTVARNAPTLLYSAIQQSQFWDGRAKTLQEQVKEVLKNPVEMNGDHGTIEKQLGINIDSISDAIAEYLKTLSPFDSPFDKYMQGDQKALTGEQVKGLNLFMGKALCGTCHAAPLFNGLAAPLYDRTVMEVIGTTRNTDFTYPQLDNDSGRYASYPVEFYMRSFKTPGLRNVGQTAPYMHNGAFATLEQVMEFYNKGGGAGLGLPVQHQTLSSSPLNLSEAEIKSIIAFLHALTDPVKKVYKVNE